MTAYEDAIRGSLKLRNALFRFAGYNPPRKPSKRRKSAPKFARPRGRPLGSKSKPKVARAKIELIKSIVSKSTGIGLKTMVGRKRSDDVIRARHVAMYATRKALGASYPLIGRHFGNRDHSTVINAMRSIEIRILDGDLETISALRAVKLGLGA